MPHGGRRAARPVRHAIVKALSDAGVPLLIGTDTMAAGYNVHQELALFVSGERNHRPSMPHFLAATNIGRTTATLVWHASTDPNASDTVTYEVQWKQFQVPGWSATISVSTPSLDLVGLKKGDKVDVRVRATDMVLNSRWNKKVQLFRTNGNPTAPSKLKASQVLHDRAKVSWNASRDVNDDITHYEVWYRRAGEAWGDAEIENADGTTTVLRDLDPLTSYDVRVRAKDTLGQGQFVGRNKLFTTVEVPNQSPPKPENITATEVTDRAALIDWDDVVDPDGDAVTYIVRYRSNGTSGWGTLYETTETSYTLTELQAGTAYDIRLMASDGKLKSARNSTNLFTTASAAVSMGWRYSAMENLASIRASLRW